MSSTRARRAVSSPVRVVWLLIGSFALTIASFVASTIAGEARARGTEAAADSITENVVPTIACVPAARSELRAIDRALQRFTRSAATGADTGPDSAALRSGRDAFVARWSLCSELPGYEPERPLRAAVESSTRALSSSLDEVVRRVEGGDRNGALDEIAANVEPAIDRIDADLAEAMEVNARQLDVLSTRIKELRTSSQTTRGVLIALSAVLASIAAVVMVRVLERFTALMQARLTEMEHFAGRVAHDVRSPLAAVGLAIELTKHEPETSARTGALDRASRTLQRVGQLVDGLLVFARAGAPPPEASEAEARDVLDDVIETLRPSAEENEIELTLDAPAALSVACTPGVLISLVSNLVGNAIKYMGPSPVRQVHVHARDLGDRMRLEVRDTGPGILPGESERLFDPYIRGAASTVPGIGLGLATVRRLAEAHGGSVGFSPNTPTGSVFWFELPKAEPASRRAGRRHAPLLSRVGLRPSARGSP